MVELKGAFRKEYKVTVVAPGVKSVKVTFPYEFIEREARKFGLTIEQFLATYQAIAQYNSFDGVFYSFEKEENKNE